MNDEQCTLLIDWPPHNFGFNWVSTRAGGQGGSLKGNSCPQILAELEAKPISSIIFDYSPPDFQTFHRSYCTNLHYCIDIRCELTQVNYLLKPCSTAWMYTSVPLLLLSPYIIIGNFVLWWLRKRKFSSTTMNRNQ